MFSNFLCYCKQGFLDTTLTNKKKIKDDLNFHLSLFNCVEMCFSFAPHVINSLKHGLSQNPKTLWHTHTHFSPFLLLFWLKFPFYRFWSCHQKLRYSGCKMVFKLPGFVFFFFFPFFLFIFSFVWSFNLIKM